MSADRDLIAACRARLAAAGENPATDPLIDYAVWAVETMPLLLDALEQSRATNQRLNLRCQEAESVARENVEACRRAGTSFGRGLANWAATDYRRKLDAIERGTQLPDGWPDGPLDEVLGELVAAVFTQFADERAQVAARSPAMAQLSGTFNLRDVGAWLAPRILELHEASQRPPLGYVAGYPDILGRQLLVQADAERAFDTRESAQQCVDQLNGLGDCIDEWVLLEVRREVQP